MYLNEGVRPSAVQPRLWRFSVWIREEDNMLFPPADLPTPAGASVPDFSTFEEAKGEGLRRLRDDEETTGGCRRREVVVFDHLMHEMVVTH